MHEDIVDWGKMKIEGKLDHLYNTQKAIPHLKDILDENITDSNSTRKSDL